jgi:anaerobic magnesium-protoporphyrin IX monomethyl ester cyclase
MRVLLVNPSTMGVFRSVRVVFPPLGLLYLASALRNRRHEVTVIDRSVDHRPVDYSSFDVVGIHSDTTRYRRALDLARMAKAGGARVVMGGPHPCFVAPDVLESGLVDVVVRGEGELTFPALLDAWNDGADLSSIPGIIFKTGGGIVDTGDPVRIADVDTIDFPARDLVDMSLYAQTQLAFRRLTSVHTSRGCPHQCRFCSSSRFDGVKWRARSSENVLAEIDHLVRDLGFGAIAFIDDNFAGSPRRVHEICDGILKRGLDVKWWCFCRVDTIVRNPDMIRHMAQAGAYSVFTGIEAASAKVLDYIDKKIGPDLAREAVKILRSNGIETWASYILGAPEEDREDMLSTIRLACDLDTEIAQFTLLTPYPGTALYDDLKDRISVTDWRKYDAVHAVFRHPRIPRLELQRLLLRAYVTFYLRHSRSIAGFFRFLSSRSYGAQIAGVELDKRKQ